MAEKKMDLIAVSTRSILGPPDRLSEQDAATYVAVLIELARIDGIGLEEKNFTAYVGENLGIGQDLLERGHKKASQFEGALGELVAGLQDRQTCVFLFRDAYLMTLLANGTDEVEWQTLDRLSGALGLSTGLARKVVRMVDDLVNLYHDYHEVLEEAGIGEH